MNPLIINGCLEGRMLRALLAASASFYTLTFPSHGRSLGENNGADEVQNNRTTP
jgi:hypothetical protein